ncbi:CPBP family intramembrane glutamic endopeptidase [Halobacteriaceae archaeon GCM10025711]
MNERRRGSAVSVGVAAGVTVMGLVFSVVVAVPVFLLGLDVLATFTLSVVLSELGFAVGALVFLAATGRGTGFLDLRRPDRRAVGYMVGGTVALFALRLALILGVGALGLPVAGNSVTDLAQEGVVASLLLLVPVSVLVIGPAEELLFRGVVQKYLYGSFSRWGAVAVASVLFALVHLPTTYYADPDPVAVAVTLAILFGLSLVLGGLYVRTDNLLVPVVAHGLYDAVLFGLAYVVLTTQGLSLPG